MNVDLRTGKVRDHLFFLPESRIHSREVHTNGYDLVNAPHQLRVLIRLVEDLTISNFQSIIANMGTLSSTMENIANGLIGDNVVAVLQGVSMNLTDISNDISNVHTKLGLLQDGFQNQNEILTLEEINSLVEGIESGVSGLQDLIDQMNMNTQGIEDIADINAQVSILLGDLTTMLTSVVSLNDNLDSFNSDAIRVHFQHALGQYQNKVTTLLGQLKELATINDLTEQVNKMLTVLVDLSGTDIHDISGQFSVIPTFDLNLMYGFFGKLVVFGTFPETNGPAWPEYLAQRLFVPVHYHFWGNITDTVDAYIANTKLEPSDLYVIMTDPQTDVTEAIDQLIQHDSRNIILSGPAYNVDGTWTAEMQELTRPGLIWNNWVPTDASGTFTKGYELGSAEFLSDFYAQDVLDLSGSDPLEYYYWDTSGSVTTRAHSIIAEKLFEQLTQIRNEIKEKIGSQGPVQDTSGEELPNFEPYEDYPLPLCDTLPYTRIVVFGDEYVDNGGQFSLRVLSDNTEPARRCNGRLYPEYIQEALGITQVTNLAVGLSYTVKGKGPAEYFGLNEQIHNIYLGNNTVLETDLIIINSGTADLRDSLRTVAEVSEIVTDCINSLILHGAKTIILSGRMVATDTVLEDSYLQIAAQFPAYVVFAQPPENADPYPSTQIHSTFAQNIINLINT